MKGAVLVAVAATMGNFLQGWDNATIAGILIGAIVYIKKDLDLETTMEGLVVAMSLIGATASTTCSGAISDWIGRRPLLIVSSLLYSVSGLVMLWSPNVYVLCVGRVLDGFGIGLAVTLVPIYISETAPPDIRGQLNTLPQFSGSGGMFLSYCMVFGMSLLTSPSWRLMLGVLSVPSLLYLVLTVFYLPESPRWLVSKGKMAEAKRVLRWLRGVEDVSGEMALLVEGLGIGGRPSIEEFSKSSVSRQGSLVVDPLVTLFGSVHETGSMSMLFPNLGSMYSVGGKEERWDDGEGYSSEAGSDMVLGSPLISRQATSLWKDISTESSTRIGGGWQLAWRRSERDGEFKRVYLHEEAAALVSQPSLYSKEAMDVGPAMVHPSETASKAPLWGALLEPGVRRALIVGVGIQILQQFSGINGVLYYTPQILEEAGVEVLLSEMGLGSESASFLISAVTTLLMLPCIGVAMRLMDVTGRRRLLLTTIPVLVVALIVMVIGNVVSVGTVTHAVISTVCVVLYFCCFVTAYGPIPNIVCSEIFPTRVRGLCIAICSLAFWICDIIVTYTLPLLLSSIGLAGVFGIYAVVCVISWLFVFFKLPETKGMPLEVITDFFALGATHPNNL